MPKLTDDTWQVIRDQWAAGASDPRAQDGGPPSQPIRDRAQLTLKHQAEWEELESIRSDVVAALQGIRTQLQPSVSSASPDRQNRKSATGTQNLPPGLGPRVTLDEHLKQATRWAALYDKAASGLLKKQEGERRAYGFDYKMQQQTAEDPVAVQRRNEMIDKILAYVARARVIEREHKERQKANAPEAHDD